MKNVRKMKRGIYLSSPDLEVPVHHSQKKFIPLSKDELLKKAPDVIKESKKLHPLFGSEEEGDTVQKFPEVFPAVQIPDSWERTQVLLEKCKIALQKRKLDYAQIYYEELKPFYSRLTLEQQHLVASFLFDLEQDMEMLRLHTIRVRLKKVY